MIKTEKEKKSYEQKYRNEEDCNDKKKIIRSFLES